MINSNHNPERRPLIQGALATWILAASKIGLASSSRIIAIRIWPSKTYTRVTLESNLPLKYHQYYFTHPKKIVLDIQNLHLNQILKKITHQIHPHDPYIKRARVGQFNQNTVRLVLELKQNIQLKIFTLKPIAEFHNRLVLDIYPVINHTIKEKDPLLALLADYNQGDLDRHLPSIKKHKAKAGKDRPIVIMLDPGHGGEDPGAVGKHKTLEKDVVLQIAQRLRNLIQKEPNMYAYMTRNEDIFIPLKVRVAKARQLGADLFISIHADAFINRQAQGTSVFALSKKGATSALARFLAQSQNKADDIGGINKSGDKYLDHTMIDLLQTATINESLILGQKVLNKVSKINKLHKSKVDQAGFAVLRAADIPSILVETAFISNPEEERKLKTHRFQQKMANSLFFAIKDYLAEKLRKG